MKYFFDTYSIIEIIEDNKNYEKYKEEEIVTSILNVGELYYSLLKKNAEAAETWHEKLKQSAMLVDAEIIKAAMKFRFNNKNKKFSFIDCVGYVLAKDKNLIFLTGDEGFENFENVEFVK
ncbi:PIN domain-containing protein [Candidatus Woesearchaeota archaeon]|nr:PIN domain-containing protein [Candidatus Woesearchaeota archaeon]